MTEEELREIEDRVKWTLLGAESDQPRLNLDDIRALIAEVRRLRMESGNVRQDSRATAEALQNALTEREQWKRECMELRVLVEQQKRDCARLRAETDVLMARRDELIRDNDWLRGLDSTGGAGPLLREWRVAEAAP